MREPCFCLDLGSVTVSYPVEIWTLFTGAGCLEEVLQSPVLGVAKLKCTSGEFLPVHFIVTGQSFII